MDIHECTIRIALDMEGPNGERGKRIIAVPHYIVALMVKLNTGIPLMIWETDPEWIKPLITGELDVDEVFAHWGGQRYVIDRLS